MGSAVIDIPDGEGVGVTLKEKKKFQFSLQPIISYLRENCKKIQFSLPPIVSYLREKKTKPDMRRVIHSTKVGVALVLVSLLFLLDPIYVQVGDNAMWAIMTVVVIFEFYAGATLSKGLNRGMGTILGGGLGCLAAALAQEVGGKIGHAIVVGIFVFIFAAAATYARLIPRIKKRYDYGALIFILTFNLVVVSGVRAVKVLKIARERLLTIGMGFSICIFISLLIFPIWASDELHDSIASKFEDLARSIEGCMEEYFSIVNEKESQPSAKNSSSCKSVLYSKSKDESLANFAKWEPWHGKFGLYYPWGRYLQMGDHLRELAATIISMEGCLQSPRQPSTTLRQYLLKEPCEAVVSLLASTLRELGESILKMRACHAEIIVPKLKSKRLELSLVISPSKLATIENGEGYTIAAFMFLLMEMVEKVEELAKEVEELGEPAGFSTH